MTVATWDVVFRPARRPWHVLAYGYDAGAGVWIVVDPCRHRIGVQAFAPPDFDRWRLDAVRDSDVLRLAIREQTSVLHPGFWCVGVVKRLLGLNSGAFRPAAFRRDMMRAGATRVPHP